ncbi:hypothetical protein NA78x_004543 [Anatilimnocola sp. NA78]|uniref:hypothetical protein n=1 Tax=Anatilimnocola sp. NA78 TaxID=3415683 RepID=UPI003CE4A403
MSTISAISKSALLLAVVAIATSGGCAIPAIDPTGEGFFSGTTSFASLRDCPLIAKHHQPPAPCVPPQLAPPQIIGPVVGPQPCAPPVMVVPVSCNPPAPPPIVVVPAVPMTPAACAVPPPAPPPLKVVQCASPTAAPEGDCENGPTLKITPNRMVAAVGSEVVLSAGICGKDGYYVMRQPLEWMLAQDGAGQIVAIGQESPYRSSYFLRHSPQKISPQYALAHTSTISQTVDRGTKDPSDDIVLKRGQSWISVTSPKEGASYITVWSPKEHNFDRRRANATIYWVDAVWAFPPCSVAPIGARNGHRLTTTVRRSGGAPVSGWTVRYEVLEGPDAVFGAGKARAVEVRTDVQGVAIADLFPQSNVPGITTVRVQIVRPAGGDVPEMIVGQGTTNVNWTAPGLSVSASGPTTIPGDGLLSYQVEVMNTGDQLSRDVVLKFTPPTNVTVLNSSPSAEMFGNRLEWRLGDLQARGRTSVKVNCRAAVDGDLRSTFMATTSDGNLKAEGTAATRVFRQALSVRMNGPDSVEVGKRATFQIEITNTGSEVLRNVTLTDRFPAELVHSDGETSPISRSIGDLQPGQKINTPAVTFIVTRAGQHSHRLDVTADGQQSATARGVVTGIQTQVMPAKLQLRFSQPQQVRAGENAEIVAEITNLGGSVARNAKLNVVYGANFTPDRATPGHQFDEARRTLTWNIDQLGAGATLSKQINLRALQADERAAVLVTLQPDQGQAETRQINIPIVTGAAREPAPVPVPRNPAATREPAPAQPPRADIPRQPPAAAALPGGNLEVTLSQTANPIPQGKTTTYIVRIKNDGSGADEDLAITLFLPAGLSFKKVVATEQTAFKVQGWNADKSQIDFTPVAMVRAREEMPPLQIEVEGTKPGMFKFQVEIRSKRNPKPIVRERETTVNMPAGAR